MNCRTFHKKLEDYLQNGLDFPARFGMERHARQCLGCGKDLANALELRQKVLELKRVKAPVDFESSLLDKIGMCKTPSRFSAFRRFWIYRLEWPSLRKAAFATSGLALLTLGIVFSYHMVTHSKHLPPSSLKATNAAGSEGAEKTVPVASSQEVLPPPQSTGNDVSAADFFKPAFPTKHLPNFPMEIFAETWKTTTARPRMMSIAERDSLDAQELDIISRSKIISVPPSSLPNQIRIKYLPASEEYFFQYVSH
jgi:hypothetical protein